jgi:hypothetical protein
MDHNEESEVLYFSGLYTSTSEDIVEGASLCIWLFKEIH